MPFHTHHGPGVLTVHDGSERDCPMARAEAAVTPPKGYDRWAAREAARDAVIAAARPALASAERLLPRADHRPTVDAWHRLSLALDALDRLEGGDRHFKVFDPTTANELGAYSTREEAEDYVASSGDPDLVVRVERGE